MMKTASRQFIRRAFTLVEVLVAMAILMIIMAILVNVVADAQDIWRSHQSRSELSENAAVFFDIITRDLRSFVASDDPIIQYQVDGTPASDSPILSFVSSSGIGLDNSDTVRLMEVGYGYDTDDSTLIRWYSTATTGGWNLYGDNTWWDSFGDSVVVCEGLYDFRVACFDRTGTALATDTVLREAPAYVQVDLTLINPELIEAMGAGNVTDTMMRDNIREFSKRIFTYRGGQ